MKKLYICPECSSPGIKVKYKAVKNILKDKSIINDTKDIFYACCNSVCNIAYFNENIKIKTDEITAKIWYKNYNEDVTVCYCSDITRKEIYESVKKGCKNISDVRRFLNKNETGHCSSKNPLGKNCKALFNFTINKAKKNIAD